MDKQLLADLLLTVSVLGAAFCIVRGFLLAQPQLFGGALLIAVGGSLAYLVLERPKADADDPLE